MNITRFAVVNNRFTLFLALVLALFGISAYFNLPKAQDPGFIIRTAVITTQFPGASPERVELLVTDKIEQVIQQMTEIDFVGSDSQTGVSVVYANFKQRYRTMRPIFDDLRRKVEAVKPDLPKGISGPFVNDEYGDVFGVIYAVTGDGFSYAELKQAADEIRNQLLLLDNVAKVNLHGVQEEAVFVEYNNARLRELGLSPQQLQGALHSVNILSAGGNVRVGRERLVLEPTGNFESVKDIKRAVIDIPGSGELLHLEDIARVYRGYKDPRDSAVHASGKPALAIAVSMKDGGNILELGEELDRILPDLRASYPHGLEIDTLSYQPAQVDAAIDAFMKNLGQAVGIVLVVMLVFLGMRTGLVVAALVPAVMATTFLVMQWFDVGINKMSLAAMIIALGLLVDNAIVMAESIMLRLERGDSRVDAVVQTGREMLVPLLTSSLTTAAAFLPIALAKSNVGEYTADIARVVTMALLISWIMAMTLIPVLAAMVMRVKQGTADDAEHFSGISYRIYRRVLDLSLRFKPAFFTIILVLFFLGIKGLGLVPQVFIPPATDPIVNAKFDMPYGTAIETTEAIADDLEGFIRDNWMVTEAERAEGRDGVVSWLTFIGEGAPRFVLGYDPGTPSARHIAMIANTTDYRMIPELSASVEQYARKRYPDLTVQLKKLENGPPVDYPIAIRLIGPDADELFRLSASLKDHLYSLPNVVAVNDNWGPQVKKLLVRVDQDRAQRAGVTSEDVALSLEASLSGTQLTEYREGDDVIPVTMRSEAADRQNLAKLDGISIYSSNSGKQVSLKQVADVEVAWQPGLIKRRDRLPAMTVNVQLAPDVTATEVNQTLLPWLDEQAKTWPRGFFYQQGGEAEAMGDAQASIAEQLPVAALIIILLLVAQFNSIRRMAIIIMTIPLGLVGVSAGLIIGNSVFGFFTILGIVALSGIIINNAIVLLDRIKIEIEQNGRDPQEAVFEACQQRLRPIFLTTATTIGGMLPLWLSHDPMFETMAISIIFGLAFATVLTLVFVPVMYSLLFRVNFKAWRLDS